MLALFLLGGTLWGCAPKRVLNGSVQSQPSKSKTPPAESAAPREALPQPEAHGKIIQPQPDDPVKSLGLGIKVATLAREQLNKPYQWGATGPEEFDCSGLVYYVFGSLDVALPRVSRDQARKGRLVKRSQLQPGDLVFFITSGTVINHVGIYIGGSRFIHAPKRYSPVRYDSLNNSWWRRRFQFGRRIQG